MTKEQKKALRKLFGELQDMTINFEDLYNKVSEEYISKSSEFKDTTAGEELFDEMCDIGDVVKEIKDVCDLLEDIICN